MKKNSKSYTAVHTPDNPIEDQGNNVDNSMDLRTSFFAKAFMDPSTRLVTTDFIVTLYVLRIYCLKLDYM